MAKSLPSCVIRSNTRYSFRAGARTIRYSWFATTFLDHQHGRRDVTSKPEIVPQDIYLHWLVPGPMAVLTTGHLWLIFPVGRFVESTLQTTTKIIFLFY